MLCCSRAAVEARVVSGDGAFPSLPICPASSACSRYRAGFVGSLKQYVPVTDWCTYVQHVGSARLLWTNVTLHYNRDGMIVV